MLTVKVASKKNNQSGMALPMALILLVIASFIIVPGLWAMQSFMKINSNMEQDTMAYYAADAGAADCIWRYKYGTEPTGTYPLTNNINGMNVVVTLNSSTPTGAPTNFFWQSSAPSGSASKAQVVIMIQKLSGTQGVFNLAAASLGGDMDMSGSAIISSDNPSMTGGDAYVNGNITTSKCCGTIGGNATATGTISSKITAGTKTSPPPPVPTLTVADPIDIAAYTLQAQTYGTPMSSFIKNSGDWDLGVGGLCSYITGDLTLTGIASINVVGTLYIGGNFSIGNGCTMTGGYVVICNGTTITMKGGSTAKLPLYQNPLFIALRGNVTIQNTKLSAIVYAPKGSVTLSGTATVYGSIYAKSIAIGGSGAIQYEAGLMGTTGLPAWMPSPGGTPAVLGYDYR